MSEGPVVRTDAGSVRGRWRAGSSERGPGRGRRRFAEFRGIPYAQPPLDELRFAAPAPAEPWAGVLEATVFGPAVPQSGPGVTSEVEGEDWLTLNVATPDPGAAGLPVLVWIHGGAYIAGTAADPMYDPAALVQAGLVVVSVNYRVGAEGFALIDGAPANRGFLDQIAALHWVRRNIAAFGGDAGQVTVAGQSAGAGSVAALLTMERARGLFRRAIAHSVPGNLCTSALAASVTATLAERLDILPTAFRRVSFADVSPMRLAEAVTALGAELPAHRDRWGRLAHTGVAVCPVVDGEILPESPWAALKSGRAAGIDLLVGHTRDEFRLFTWMAGRLGNFTEDEATTMLELFAPTPAAADAYRSAQLHAGPGELLETVGSDALFRMPSLQLARANRAAGGTSFLFELCLESPAMGGVLGACHSLDVPLAFGSLDSPTGRGLLGDEPSPAAVVVSEELQRAWVRFATTGDPGWTAYDADEQWTRVLDAEPYTGPYPERTSARIWGDHLPMPFALASEPGEPGQPGEPGEPNEPAIRTA